MDLRKFELYQLRLGLAQRTIKSNTAQVRTFLNAHLPVDEYFISKIQTRKKNYLNRQIDALRVYGKFLGDEKLATYPKFRNKQKPVKSYFSDEEMIAFLSVTEGTAKHYKDHYESMNVFWHIFAYTGMRSSEIAGLTLSQIDFANKCFHLGKTKTGKPRDVPIHEALYPLLYSYCKGRESLLFPSRMNKTLPIGQDVWGKSFRKRLKLAGIPKREGLTAYSIRHTFGTRMGDEDGGRVSLRVLQELMGHDDPKTTMRYQHPQLPALRRALRRLPIGNKYLKPSEKKQILKEAILELEKYLAPMGVKLKRLEEKDKGFSDDWEIEEDKHS